jgi:formylglycine-generating enzyme required for sulfatase activity
MRNLLPLLFIPFSFFVNKDKDILSSKAIENRMIEIKKGLYANKFETTNEEYKEFLNWVSENQPEMLTEVSVRNEGWTQINGEIYAKNYFSNDGFNQYPVVNITYKGAIEFCSWLTVHYNQLEKKEFKKVKFRLPSEAEWVHMATNGKDYRPLFPWGSPYLKNKKGQYLANFLRIGNQNIKVNIDDRSKVELQSKPDAGLFMTKVDSYMATGAGLHNLSGNAAEMMAEIGQTKGGSWGSSGYYLRIDAEDEFKGFNYSPYVGFRYVMEVIEE